MIQLRGRSGRPEAALPAGATACTGTGTGTPADPPEPALSPTSSPICSRRSRGTRRPWPPTDIRATVASPRSASPRPEASHRACTSISETGTCDRGAPPTPRSSSMPASPLKASSATTDTAHSSATGSRDSRSASGQPRRPRGTEGTGDERDRRMQSIFRHSLRTRKGFGYRDACRRNLSASTCSSSTARSAARAGSRWAPRRVTAYTVRSVEGTVVVRSRSVGLSPE